MWNNERGTDPPRDRISQGCCYCRFCCVGPPGPQGMQGFPGPEGRPGPQGPRGSRGEMGLRGLSGQQGPQGIQGEPGQQGQQGESGQSAYEIAVEQGYIGTEEEWIESLKGEQGLQGEPGTQGLQGEPGQQGQQGESGQSAYEIAVEQGYIGTEEEWIESLKGEQGLQGEPGTQGLQGEPGQQGQQGESGQSAYEIAVEQGYIGTEEEWIESLKGEQGIQGEPGPQGIQGEPGPQGIQGQQGESGQSAYEIAVEQGYIGTEEEWIESLKGEQGQQGEPGPSITWFMPFATGSNASALHASTTGQPTNIMLSSFGGHSSGINITNLTTSFNMPAGDGYQHAFTVSKNCTIKGIKVNFVNWAAFIPANNQVYPFVILAVAPRNSIGFTFLSDTLLYSLVPYTGTVAANTLIYNNLNDLNISVPDGSRMAICCGFRVDGAAAILAYEYYFYYSGSILFE